MVTIIVRSGLVLLFIISLLACGRVGVPFTPEELASQSVRKLLIVARADGIEFAWSAPRDDIRGEPLKSLDEYEVARKVIETPTDFLDPQIEFVTLEKIPDQFLVTLKELQEQALEKGLPRRKVKVDPKFENYSFIDKSVEPGKRYVYQIVPINQGDVAGQVEFFADIVFDGINSKISLTESLEQSEVEPVLEDQP